MTTWHSKALGDGADALAPTQTVQQAFAALMLTKNLPADYALFSYYDLRENVVTLYFSPSASDLALTFGAAPCDKPVRKEGFALLNGSSRSWAVLFGK